MLLNLMKIYSTPSQCTSNNHEHCWLPSSRASLNQFPFLNWGRVFALLSRLNQLRTAKLITCSTHPNVTLCIGISTASFACQTALIRYLRRRRLPKKSVRTSKRELLTLSPPRGSWRINASFIKTIRITYMFMV